MSQRDRVLTRTFLLLAWSIVAALFFSGEASAREIERCIERQPSFESQGPTFELMDLRNRRIWVTRDWKMEEFDDFRFPLHQRTWRKNDPRSFSFESSSILQSPGCDDVGQYTYLHAYGRSFLHVVDVRTIDQTHSRSLDFTEVTLEKHQVLTFESGKAVAFLTDDLGMDYIGISHQIGDSGTEAPLLPPGWNHRVEILENPVEVSTVGELTVVRTSTGQTFQKLY